MFVEDFYEEFYKLVKGKHLLLLVNYDVDALCACKILQYLFRCDHTLYTLVPVEGVQDLVESYHKYSEQLKFVFLVNCGGTIDIVETLQPEEDVTIFIVDSHKPTDVCNVYSSSQVRIIGKPDEDDSIPEFNDIFLDTESEDESGDESRSLSEEEILKRRERRLWEEKRNRLMFEYTQFSYYGRASSLVVFDIVWKLGKDSMECLWWSIVGVTYQVLLGLILEQKYADELPVLQLHMARLIPSNDNQGQEELGRLPPTKITSQRDLKIALYRHWNVQASLRNSMSTSIKLCLWTIRGEKRLHQLLAEIGLPLQESKQNFCAMDVNLRNDFFNMIEKVASTYDLDDLIFPSFTLSGGYRKSYQASDYVYGMIALLDQHLRGKSTGDCFLEALDCLSKNKYSILEEGIEGAKKLLTSIFKQVQSLLDMKQIISAGPFLYFVLQEGAVDSKLVGTIHSLSFLARCALYAYNSVSRNKKSGLLPLIASASASTGTCLILGIPPVSEIIPRNFFGKAFNQAAESVKVDLLMNYSDSSVIKIKTDDRPKFFDALVSILS